MSKGPTITLPVKVEYVDYFKALGWKETEGVIPELEGTAVVSARKFPTPAEKHPIATDEQMKKYKGKWIWQVHQGSAGTFMGESFYSYPECADDTKSNPGVFNTKKAAIKEGLRITRLRRKPEIDVKEVIE